MTGSEQSKGHKVLVVGATGFLGSKILRNLSLEKTDSPRAMSRRGKPADANAAVEWVRGDMMNPASLDAALKGVDVVASSANGYMMDHETQALHSENRLTSNRGHFRGAGQS